jgi:hypothetical protein
MNRVILEFKHNGMMLPVEVKGQIKTLQDELSDLERQA